jgi:hypothetical protein
MKRLSAIVFGLGLLAGLTIWGCSTDDRPSGPGPDTEYGDITGKVYDDVGDPIEGASVSVGERSALTQNDGSYVLTDVSVGDHHLSASSSGFTTTYRNIDLVADETLHVSDLVLADVETVVLNGSEGGTAATSDGAGSVEFGANAFETSGEKTYTGDVIVEINAFLPTDEIFPEVFPGYFEGVREDGSTTMFASYGFVTVNLVGVDKAPLGLAPGVTAHLYLDIGEEKAQDAPATIPMWYYDENEGVWHEEGESVLQGTVYVAEVSHFTSWNWDLPWNQTCYVEGYVKDDLGNPIAMALVSSQVVGGRSGWWGDHQTRTNESGFFRVRARVNDEVDIWARKNGVRSEIVRLEVGSDCPYVLDDDLIITPEGDTK